MSDSEPRHVTVILQQQIMLHGEQYPNKWCLKHPGNHYRCPIDEAYTLVKTGRASYPDGLEALKKLYYTPSELEKRVDDLEAYTSFLKKVKYTIDKCKKTIQIIKYFVSTNWKMLVALSTIGGFLAFLPNILQFLSFM